MTLLEQIGQMLIVGFRGFEMAADSTVAKDISERNVGGIILFDTDITTASLRNIQSPPQLKRLVSQTKALSESNLIVSIDHEGGFVCRLKEKYGFPKTSTAFKLAQLPETDFRCSLDGMVATLAEAGINFNFAPVVDTNVNPSGPAIGKYERSFSDHPDVVFEKASAVIRAHHEQNVLTSLKHFPGHGSATNDSHFGITDISDTWSEIELLPFEAIIKAGIADTITTAHVFNRHLDAEYPATLSPIIITEILRKRMGFEGVVVSDDMQMGAITQKYSLETAVRLAIQAGVDILVFGNNVAYDEYIAEKVIHIIYQLVAAGTIPESRILQSAERIQALKNRLRNPHS